VWTSTADGKFFVTKDPRGNTLGRGTRVTLFLKEDAAEYVEQEKIKNLVKKYSEFINYPIKVYLSKDVKEEVEEPPEDESVDAEPKKKTVTKTVWEWETVNEIKAIWMRDKT
jgi:heat shock protein beta